jgi:hypothetical protein
MLSGSFDGIANAMWRVILLIMTLLKMMNIDFVDDYDDK